MAFRATLRLAESSAQAYVRRRRKWKREKDWNTKQKLERGTQTQLDIFGECMRNLGIRY